MPLIPIYTHWLFYSLAAFSLLSIRQQFLDRFLFFQQNSSHNPRLDAGVTDTPPITTRHGPFSLGGASNGGLVQVFDPRQGLFAVSTAWTFGFFHHALFDQLSTGSAHGATLVLQRIVGMAAAFTGPAGIGHAADGIMETGSKQK